MNQNTAQRISRLIKEALSTPPKKDKCNCGCHSCENVGNPGPVLNESLNTKPTISENIQYHINNKLAITENTFRYGSEAFLNLWAEARELYENKIIYLNDIDKELVTETDLGKWGVYEGKKVPLDLLLMENDSELGGKEDVEFTTSIFMLPYIELLKAIEKDYGRGDAYYEVEQAIFDKNIDQIPSILRRYELDKEYSHLTRVNEAEKKKTPALGKPKRGGSKKFYVYVRDPKSKRIKKVSFGMAGGGLRAKLNNPKARQAFAKRHNCAQKKDKTKASYWSCRLPRYAKALGFNTTFSGYW